MPEPVIVTPSLEEVCPLVYSDKWDAISFTPHGNYVRYQNEIWLIPPGVTRWTERPWAFRGPFKSMDAAASGLYVERENQIRRIPLGGWLWEHGEPVYAGSSLRWWKVVTAGLVLGRRDDVVLVPFGDNAREAILAGRDVAASGCIVTSSALYYDRGSLYRLTMGEQEPQLVLEVRQSKNRRLVIRQIWGASDQGLYVYRDNSLRRIPDGQPSWDAGVNIVEGHLGHLLSSPLGVFPTVSDLVFSLPTSVR